MATKDIFDEIISCLKLEAENSPLAAVNDDVLRDFFTPVETEKTPPAAAAPGTSTPRHNQFTQKQPVNLPPGNTPGPTPAPTTNNSSSPDPATLSWHGLWEAAMGCRKCQLCENRTNVVFGDGNRNADLMFIGEGPGRDEDMQGLPFVGKAGQLLTKMITAMQFTREEVYIANIIKCRPPNNRNPLPEEADACLPYLKRQIQLVNPKAIVILGAVPLQFLFNRRGVTRLRGTWLDYEGIPAMVTFHPAFLLRYPQDKRKAWSDLQQVMKKFDKVYKP
jgi:DNA polymerase